MTSIHRFLLACCAFLVATISQPAVAQCEYGTGSWHVGVGQQAAGPMGSVAATMAWDPDGAGPLPVVLLAAGSFRIAGGTTVVNSIAKWDGSTWSPVGNGFNGYVSSLTTFNGELIAAGNFTASGATTCNRIARWNGTSWQPLGTGLNDYVTALAVYNGRLYAGGWFTTAGGVPANAIANWDGAIWRTLGNRGVGNGGGVAAGTVNALGVFDNHLIVGGGFDSAGGVANTEALARWNGTAWSSYGVVAYSPGFPGPEIYSITTWASGTIASSMLYIAGRFDSVAGLPVVNVARYQVTLTTNGPWIAAGAGLGNLVNKLQAFSSGQNSHVVYASTYKGTNGNTWPGGMYLFSSNVWNQYAPETVNSIGSYGGIIAGLNGLSRRVGSDWQAFGNGINGSISKLLAHQGDLVAFGTFTTADQQVVNGVARLDETGWQPYLAGVLGGSTQLEVVGDAASHNGDFFVAGRTAQTGANYSARVFRWNGASWSQTFQSSTGWSTSPEFDKHGSSLYMTHASSVYLWNGAAWSQQGFALPNNEAARGTLWINNALHAYGDNLYRLDGGAWVIAGDNPSWMLYDGVVWNGRVFLTTATQGPSTIVELINGQLVTILEDFYASQYTVFNNRLFAIAGGGIMEFDGSTWTMRAPLQGTVNDLAVVDGKLIACGSITSVHDTVSPWFARLLCCPSDINGDGSVNVTDLLAVIGSWGTCPNPVDCPADISPVPSGDDAVNVTDLLAVISGWGACQ